jgi:GNAT superfamily N-acetyltransferase
LVTAAQPSTRFEILDMTEQDLPAARALSGEVNWPHRLEDWQFVFSVGQGIVARSGDQLIGTAMWWVHDRRIARLGMVIVKPTIQRSGVGRALMCGILDRIVEPTVLLNATQQGKTLYRQLGFQDIGAIGQHQGVPSPTPLVRPNANGRIRPLRRNDLTRLVELDAAASGAHRVDVMAALIENGEAIVLDEVGETAGFACCRRFGRGHVIGPVVARDTASARALIAHLIGANAGKFMRIDVPGESGLSEWLDGLGLVRVDTAVTMVRGAPPPQTDRYHVYGAINQALG